MISLCRAALDDGRSARLHGDGMALVDRAADYLGGAGRKAARGLSPDVAAAYAAESMRLTTLLMSISSWLIIRRALSSGRLSLEEARVERARIVLDVISRPSHNLKFERLPVGLRDLVHETLALRDRIITVDRLLFPDRYDALVEPEATAASRPVADALARLETEFARSPA